MKALVFSMLALGCVGCTSLKPVDVPADELQRQLVAGELVRPGDRVRLVTADETVHKFRVTGVSPEQGMVLGRDDRVPINDIVAVETREVSVGRTALLTGGAGVGMAVIIAIAIAPAILLGGG
jgi:hypothetical protein